MGLAQRGGLLDGAGRAFERDEVEALQLGRDPPPALPGRAFGDSDQQQREPADDHVGVDAVLEPVEDGKEFQGGLEVAEGAFCFAQVLVAERDLLGREVGVGAGEQVLAVEAFLGGDLAKRLSLGLGPDARPLVLPVRNPIALEGVTTSGAKWPGDAGTQPP